MSDYNVDDLLDLLKEASEKEPSFVKESKSNSNDDISNFIEEFSIESGISRIPNYIIYYTYREVFNGKSSKTHLFRELTRRGFIRKRTGKQRSYLLNSDSFDLSREGKLKAKYHDKEEKEKR